MSQPLSLNQLVILFQQTVMNQVTLVLHVVVQSILPLPRHALLFVIAFWSGQDKTMCEFSAYVAFNKNDRRLDAWTLAVISVFNSSPLACSPLQAAALMIRHGPLY